MHVGVAQFYTSTIALLENTREAAYSPPANKYRALSPHTLHEYSRTPPKTTPRRFEPKTMLTAVTFLNELEKINALEVIGYTPQRSIVALSVADMMHKVMINPEAEWKDSFDYVNKTARWHGFSLDSLKDKLKIKLSPKI